MNDSSVVDLGRLGRCSARTHATTAQGLGSAIAHHATDPAVPRQLPCIRLAMPPGFFKGLVYLDEEISGDGLRGTMHLPILIPVLAILVSVAFGAVSVAWDSNRRATTSMSAIFACTGVWGLLDLMTFLETDAASARSWILWMHLPALLLGPSVTWLLGQTFPQIGDRLYGLARAGFVLCLVLGVSAALLPGSIDEVVATDWGGWIGRYGPISVGVVPLGTILPLLAVFEVSQLKSDRRAIPVDRGRVRAMTIAVCVSLFASVMSEYVMPLLEIAVPRLGALSISCVSAAAWFFVIHDSDGLAVTPEGMARSMFEELHDGIALVQLDGTILALNRRFGEMTGRPTAELIGATLVEWVEPSLDEICAGLEDRESGLRGVDGGSLPVSLSSSVARGRDERPIGAVVVVRDLREVDALRRRLLTSGRLAAIGELAAGIAHEVNNPIAFIRADLNLLAERLDEIRNQMSAIAEDESQRHILGAVHKRIEIALEGIEEVAGVVSDVREFAHAGGAGQGGSDPIMLVEGAMRLARLQRGQEVHLRVIDAGCENWIDSGQELKQVLLALVLALVDKMESGGEVAARVASDQKQLCIQLIANRLTEDADGMIRRFELIDSGDLQASHAEFRVVIATELIHQLGASCAFTSSGPNALSIELNLPIEVESIE